MKDDMPPKKSLRIKFFIVTALLIFIGLGIAFSMISIINRRWIDFSVYLAVTVVLIIITCPLAYKGDLYECGKCGHKFRVNAYTVLFTKDKRKIYDGDGAPTKYVKLKCPHCKTSDFCKRHWEQL